ncbi:MAG: alpha/beta fold hydrolase [Cellvibrionaceae bacterium]
MQNITWNGVRLRIQSHNVQVGSSQLALRRCYRNAEGTPILLLSGFLDSSQIFLPKFNSSAQDKGGLATFLASEGYDVYLADLRGKGDSWPQASRRASWGIHESICEDIPAHLAMIDKLRPGVPQFWMGQDLGSLQLLAAFGRFQSEGIQGRHLFAPVVGMAHFSASRRRQVETWVAKQKYNSWNAYCALSRLMAGYITLPFGESVSRETLGAFETWRQWQEEEKWVDPVDAYDYREALSATQLPPSLYITNREQELWGSPTDCRALISELGPHDGRMIIVSKKGGNERDYTVNGLLRHPSSCTDHFQQLKYWLEEHNPLANDEKTEELPNEEPAVIASV